MQFHEGVSDNSKKPSLWSTDSKQTKRISNNSNKDTMPSTGGLRLPGFEVIKDYQPNNDNIKSPHTSSDSSTKRLKKAKLKAEEKVGKVKKAITGQNSHSLENGLFQVQSQLEKGLPVAALPTEPESAGTNKDTTQTQAVPIKLANSSQPERETPELQRYITHPSKDSAIIQVHQGDSKQSKRHKLSNLRKPGSYSTNSSESNVAPPIYSTQMLRNPILKDTSMYDSKNKIISEKGHRNNTFNRELLTKTINDFTFDSDDDYEKFADILTENERGWFILGYPFFSSNMLFPTDPYPWTYGFSGVRAAPGDIDNFPLPDPSWTWTWNRWYVDMSYDVDDQGWSYSWRFGSPIWHGSHVWFHSFVRRRRWVRLRHRKIAIKEEEIEALANPFQADNTEVMTPISPGSPVGSIRSFRSGASASTHRYHYAINDYQAAMKDESESARKYGHNYFTVPTVGRFEYSKASSRRNGPSSITSSNIPDSTGRESPRKSFTSLTSANLQGQSGYASFESTPRQSFYANNRDSMESLYHHNLSAHLHSSAQVEHMGSYSPPPLSLSDLLVDLKACRIDRERSDLVVKFASDVSNHSAVVAALKTHPNHKFIRQILQEFVHLESKQALVRYLRDVLDNLTTILKKSKTEHSANLSKNKDKAKSSYVPKKYTLIPSKYFVDHILPQIERDSLLNTNIEDLEPRHDDTLSSEKLIKTIPPSQFEFFENYATDLARFIDIIVRLLKDTLYYNNEPLEDSSKPHDNVTNQQKNHATSNQKSDSLNKRTGNITT